MTYEQYLYTVYLYTYIMILCRSFWDILNFDAEIQIFVGTVWEDGNVSATFICWFYCSLNRIPLLKIYPIYFNKIKSICPALISFFSEL